MTNKEIRAKVKEELSGARGRKFIGYILAWLLVAGLVGGVIVAILSFIPKCGYDIGSLISSIFIFVVTVGLLMSLINLYNGKDSEETPLKFLSHGFSNFKIIICTFLWVMVKCIVPIIVMIIGIVGLIVKSANMVGLDVDKLTKFDPNAITSLTANISNEDGLVLLGFLAVYIIGLILMIIVGLNYQSVSYELIDSIDKGIRAKEIVENAKNKIYGYRGRWFRMCLLYAFCMWLAMIGIGFIIGFILGIFNPSLAMNMNEETQELLSLAVYVVWALVVFPVFYSKMIISCYELQKEMSGQTSAPAVEAQPTAE